MSNLVFATEAGALPLRLPPVMQLERGVPASLRTLTEPKQQHGRSLPPDLGCRSSGGFYPPRPEPEGRKCVVLSPVRNQLPKDDDLNEAAR
jgi:hypothetical protein